MGIRWHLTRVVTAGLLATSLAACGSMIEFDQSPYLGSAAPGGSPPTMTTPPPGPYLDDVIADPYIETAPTFATSDPAIQPAPRKPDASATPQVTPPPPSAIGPTGSCDWTANLERAKRGREAEWIILDTGAWGRAEVPGDRIWIAPRTPCSKVYSVAVHEWVHHMQGVVYGDWAVVQRELAPYGGPEMVADCGALLLGATWIKYGCPGWASNDAAAAILRAERPDPRR